MSDSDNTYLKRIAKSCANLEAFFQVAPPFQPQEDMDVTVTNFPAVQTVAVNNFPASIQVSNFPGSVNAVVTNVPAVTVNNFPLDVAVNNFPSTQAVSAAALPLPVGAATEATLASILAKLSQTNYGKTVNYFPLVQGSAGAVVIAAASPGNRHKVVGFLITLPSNGTVQFLSALTPLTGQIDIPARGNVQDPVSVLEPTFETAVGEPLSLVSAGGAAKGYVVYLTEP